MTIHLGIDLENTYLTRMSIRNPGQILEVYDCFSSWYTKKTGHKENRRRLNHEE
jgi:hypothetical protein